MNDLLKMLMNHHRFKTFQWLPFKPFLGLHILWFWPLAPLQCVFLRCCSLVHLCACTWTHCSVTTLVSLSCWDNLVLSYFEAIVCDPPSAYMYVSVLSQLSSFSYLQVYLPNLPKLGHQVPPFISLKLPEHIKKLILPVHWGKDN